MADKKVMQGTPIVCTAIFTVGGVRTDPTSVVFKMKGPSFGSSEVTFTEGVDSEVTNPSTGVYVGTFGSDTEGVHYCRVVGAGAAAAATEEAYEVYPSVYDSP
jgi:hypothetical protein